MARRPPPESPSSRLHPPPGSLLDLAATATFAAGFALAAGATSSVLVPGSPLAAGPFRVSADEKEGGRRRGKRGKINVAIHRSQLYLVSGKLSVTSRRLVNPKVAYVVNSPM